VLASKVSAGCSTLAYVFLSNMMGPPERDLMSSLDPPSFPRVHRRVACAYVGRDYVGGGLRRMIKERTRESL